VCPLLGEGEGQGLFLYASSALAKVPFFLHLHRLALLLRGKERGGALFLVLRTELPASARLEGCLREEAGERLRAKQGCAIVRRRKLRSWAV